MAADSRYAAIEATRTDVAPGEGMKRAAIAIASNTWLWIWISSSPARSWPSPWKKAEATRFVAVPTTVPITMNPSATPSP